VSRGGGEEFVEFFGHFLVVVERLSIEGDRNVGVMLEFSVQGFYGCPEAFDVGVAVEGVKVFFPTGSFEVVCEAVDLGRHVCNV
jgi:hypothetical protein